MQDSVIDWELASKLAGNNRLFAKELFTLLVKDLKDDLIKIKTDYISNHLDELKNRIHRLHGALCYCGAPRLKKATAALENALHEQAHSQIQDLLMQFEFEANELIKQITSPTF